MLARSIVSLAGHPLRAARLSAGLVRSLPALATAVGRPTLPLLDRLPPRDDGAVLARTSLRAPATPFNCSITPHRRFAFRRIPLADVKPIRTAFGLTVHEVVIALCAGALRRWLADHDALPAAPLIAAVPVSVRTTEQRGAFGNRISVMFAALPTHLADPADRLRAVHDVTRAAKEQHQALPADLLANVTEFAMPAIAGRAARVAARLRLVERVSPFNLIVSNVPGPIRPLYLAGAQLLAIYPVSAIADGQGLNITVLGYRDSLHFGLVSCRELVPDLADLAGHLATELDALRALIPGNGGTNPGDARRR